MNRKLARSTGSALAWSRSRRSCGRRSLLTVYDIAMRRGSVAPGAIARAAWKRQRHNPDVTEFSEIPGRSHSLVIDDGWQTGAETALDFIKRFA